MIRRTLAWVGAALGSAALAACATGGSGIVSDAMPVPRGAAAPNPQGEAYYHYSAAQMAAQAGRFNDAIPAIREALKHDPTSAFLWTTLAQWLVRGEQYDEAIVAATA